MTRAITEKLKEVSPNTPFKVTIASILIGAVATAGSGFHAGITFNNYTRTAEKYQKDLDDWRTEYIEHRKSDEAIIKGINNNLLELRESNAKYETLSASLANLVAEVSRLNKEMIDLLRSGWNAHMMQVYVEHLKQKNPDVDPPDINQIRAMVLLQEDEKKSDN